MNYQQKYLKYKNKYLALKNLYGGNSEELLKAIESKNYDKIIENLKKVSPIESYNGTNPLKKLFDNYSWCYDSEDDNITNDKYINIFNEIKKIHNLNYEDIKPYFNGCITNESPEKAEKITDIFGKPSKSICTDTIIPLKNIIISYAIIQAIADLSNEKKGRFNNMTFEDINEQLLSEGYKIKDDKTHPLDRMNKILSDRPLDDINVPIHISSDEDEIDSKYYDIVNGRHRVSRALIENRESICAQIKK